MALYMVHNWDKERQAHLAVITDSDPRFNDEITVLTVKLLPTQRDCRKWFKRMRKERPWETRQ